MSQPDGWSSLDPSHPPGPANEPAGRLRPQSLGTLFEISVRVLRRHWRVHMLIALVLQTPVALLSATTQLPLSVALLDVLLAMDESGDGSVVLSEAQLHDLGVGLLVAIVGSALAGILAAVATVGFARVVARDYHFSAVTFEDAGSVALRRAIPALATQLVLTAVLVGMSLAGTIVIAVTLAVLAPDGVMTGGPGVFVALVEVVLLVVVAALLGVRWALAASVVALEDVGPLRSLRRSWHLTAGHAWRTFVALLVGTLAVMVLSAIVTQLLSVLVVDGLAGMRGQTLVAETLVGAATVVLFAPVTPVIMTVLYFDQRLRRDGWALTSPDPLMA